MTEIADYYRLLFARVGEGGPAPGPRDVDVLLAKRGAGRLPGVQGTRHGPRVRPGGADHAPGPRGCSPARWTATRPAGSMAIRTGATSPRSEPRARPPASTSACAWRDLDASARDLALHGFGDRELEVDWHYRRGARDGCPSLPDEMDRAGRPRVGGVRAEARRQAWRRARAAASIDSLRPLAAVRVSGPRRWRCAWQDEASRNSSASRSSRASRSLRTSRAGRRGTGARTRPRISAATSSSGSSAFATPASATCRSTGRRPRSRPARRSASAWRPRSAAD